MTHQATYTRQRMVMYWVLILLACTIVSITAISVGNSVVRAHDADKQLLKTRDAATRRIDLLTQQNNELAKRVIVLERENAILTNTERSE